MAKIKSKYVCQNCGYETAGYLGKCPECGTQLTDGGFCPICDLGEKDYD